MKEKLKKAFLKSFLGIPIGISLIMISYVFAYLIGGEEIFKLEISQLQSIDILLKQIVAGGIYGYLSILAIYNLLILKNQGDKKMMEHPYKNIFYAIVSGAVPISIIFAVLENTNIFSDNMIVVNMIVFVILFIASSVIIALKDIKDSKLVEMINRKLKERNS